MKVLDTHVHVWDTVRLDYPWLADAPALDRRFRPEEIDRADGASTRMVFVEAGCRRDLRLDEVRFVETSVWPELVGIVAAADLRSPALDGQLDAMCEAGRVVGIRHSLQDEKSDFFDDPAALRGLRLLGRHGLTFDACVRHTQLPALARMLEQTPETAVVLDHIGNPPIDAGLSSAEGRAWARAIRRIAARTTVSVKLSGLAAEAGSRETYERHADDFIACALDAFGPQRSMLGSDWPVSRTIGAGTSFADWVERVQRVAALDADDWSAVAMGTGSRFYDLDE